MDWCGEYSSVYGGCCVAIHGVAADMTLCLKDLSKLNYFDTVYAYRQKNKIAKQDGHKKTCTFHNFFHIDVIPVGGVAERTISAILDSWGPTGVE